jgi:hypothetical protein
LESEVVRKTSILTKNPPTKNLPTYPPNTTSILIVPIAVGKIVIHLAVELLGGGITYHRKLTAVGAIRGGRPVAKGTLLYLLLASDTLCLLECNCNLPSTSIRYGHPQFAHQTSFPAGWAIPGTHSWTR